MSEKLQTNCYNCHPAHLDAAAQLHFNATATPIAFTSINDHPVPPSAPSLPSLYFPNETQHARHQSHLPTLTQLPILHQNSQHKSQLLTNLHHGNSHHQDHHFSHYQLYQQHQFNPLTSGYHDHNAAAMLHSPQSAMLFSTSPPMAGSPPMSCSPLAAHMQSAMTCCVTTNQPLDLRLKALNLSSSQLAAAAATNINLAIELNMQQQQAKSHQTSINDCEEQPMNHQPNHDSLSPQPQPQPQSQQSQQQPQLQLTTSPKSLPSGNSNSTTVASLKVPSASQIVRQRSLTAQYHCTQCGISFSQLETLKAHQLNYCSKRHIDKLSSSQSLPFGDWKTIPGLQNGAH